MQHVFIIGGKGFTYGGYETFLDKLTEYHQYKKNIKYHIACKANGPGMTDETKLVGTQIISNTEYVYHNAHCFKIKLPEWGSIQAIIYDIKALQYCCDYIKKNKIEHSIVYVLSSRVGPVIGYFAKKIHKLGGKYYNNPDGREMLRKKYSWCARKYWSISERGMVKHSDLVICDSITIEKIIQRDYKQYRPNTTFIAYGSDVTHSSLEDCDPKYVNWLREHELHDKKFYCSVGRFVPENNFEVMIHEFMNSKTDKDFAIITTKNDRFLAELDQKLHFSNDKRIKFVGTVYNQELLKKIRENSYAYLHGHEVGGTNPSLLEALGATKLNLLYDVEFNKEVAVDAALYWSKQEGNLATLLERVDHMSETERDKFGEKAKNRIKKAYQWQQITDMYLEKFLDT